MRKRFPDFTNPQVQAIESVVIDTKSRHQLPALLAGLQYIYVTPSLNKSVLDILERDIIGDNNHLGRKGMSLWEIFILGSLRLNLNIDYDSLENMANYHEQVRGILGVHNLDMLAESRRRYSLQSLKDNVALLSESSLQSINEIVVKAGHSLKKKIESEEKTIKKLAENGEKSTEESPLRLEVKTDSYVVESTVKFPTDIGLLWESGNKCLLLLCSILLLVDLSGWRSIGAAVRKLKKHYRIVSNIHRKKGKNYTARLQKACRKYLACVQQLRGKLAQSLIELESMPSPSKKLQKKILLLRYYYDMFVKHEDLVRRRIMEGEKIPHSEKVFSIYEPHVEWISKGKANKSVELGHLVLVSSDQYGFIIDVEVAVGKVDVDLSIPLAERLQKRFTAPTYKLERISFDRGFFSQTAEDKLSKIFEFVVMPKPGKKGTKRQNKEESPEFVAARKAHSAVESSINELEQSGVDQVPDKGLNNFKRYVILGTLAHNLKRLGKVVIENNLLAKQVVQRQAA